MAEVPNLELSIAVVDEKRIIDALLALRQATERAHFWARIAGSLALAEIVVGAAVALFR